jgi:3-methyladenine DNA glycosylase AlkC
MSMANRKGANRKVDVPACVLEQLNTGMIETKNLSECLVVDFSILMAHVFPDLTEKAKASINASDGITKRMATASMLLQRYLSPDDIAELARHPSDIVRGWAAYTVAIVPDLSLKQRLDYVYPLANDHHFGVREWAWLSIRPYISSQLEEAIDLLIPWLNESSHYLRRFAVESTRPRGVWCSHISQLKQTPDIGLPLLEPVRSDVSHYVQDSVANWLNDAAKSTPEWVTETIERWQIESNTSETSRICQRAVRNLTAKKQYG